MLMVLNMDNKNYQCIIKLIILLISIGLSAVIAFCGESVLKFFRGTYGIPLFMFIFVIFFISKIATYIYNKGKCKGDFCLFFVMLADIGTIATIGLNISIEFVSENKVFSEWMVFCSCLILLFFMVYTYQTPKKDLAVSHDETKSTEPRLSTLENRIESIYFEVSHIQKSVNNQTIWLMIIVLTVVLVTAYLFGSFFII